MREVAAVLYGLILNHVAHLDLGEAHLKLEVHIYKDLWLSVSVVVKIPLVLPVLQVNGVTYISLASK